METETARLSEIQEETVEFLTFPYIALGKLSLITGDPLPWELERGKKETKCT